MAKTTARPTRCFRCGTLEDFPILARIIETGSGPGGMLYACAACARDELKRHMAYCADCVLGTGECVIAESMRELQAASREARLS